MSESASGGTTASGSANPGSSIAGMTLSQSHNPTQGLQGYDLARRILRFDPRLQRSHAEAAHRLRASGTKHRSLEGDRRSALAPIGTPMKKDLSTMDELKKMLETLQASVVGIANSSADNREELITKSFGEFGTAFEPLLQKLGDEAAVEGAEELAKMAPEGTFEPMFKGLGCVGRVADLVAMIARQVATIKTGKERYESDTVEADPASEEVAELLDHAVALGELALRAAVNEHVDIADPDDAEEEGLTFIKLANAEDPDNEAACVLVKCYLPEELAKFACDPGSLDMAIVQRGTTLLLEGGISEDNLTKVFELEDMELLNKDGDVIPPPADDGSQTDPNAMQPDDGSADPNDPIAQLEIAGRIMAAGMMQIEHCMQLLEGGSAQVDPNADPGADPTAQLDDGSGTPPDGTDDGSTAETEAGTGGATAPVPAEAPAGGSGSEPPPAKDDKKKPPMAKLADGTGDDELRKLHAQIASLTGQRDELAKHGGEAIKVIERLSALPAPAKGVKMQALSKHEDAGAGGAGEDMLSKLVAEYQRAPTEQAKQQVLLKASFKKIPAGDVLAKLA